MPVKSRLSNSSREDAKPGNMAVVTGGFAFSVVRVVAPQTDGLMKVYRP